MPSCLVFLIALIGPRVVLILTWLMNPPFIMNAYGNWIIPLLGLLFLPITTLAYAWATTFEPGAWSLQGLIVMVIALLIDLGSQGGGAVKANPKPT